jgi:hypothetical protein
VASPLTTMTILASALIGSCCLDHSAADGGGDLGLDGGGGRPCSARLQSTHDALVLSGACPVCRAMAHSAGSNSYTVLSVPAARSTVNTHSHLCWASSSAFHQQPSCPAHNLGPLLSGSGGDLRGVHTAAWRCRDPCGTVGGESGLWRA